jgi:hypothetical protein
MSPLTMSENGRILIPAALCEDGPLVLTPAPQRNQKLRAYFDRHLNLRETEGTVDQFIAERREQAKREDTERPTLHCW